LVLDQSLRVRAVHKKNVSDPITRPAKPETGPSVAVSLKADCTTAQRPHRVDHDCTHLAITNAHILCTPCTCQS